MERKILLNPGPATTSQTVKDALVVPDICPREQEFGDLVEGICTDLARVVHGEKNYTTVLFAGSGTAAMEAVVSSIPPAGEKILVVENGAYGKRFAEIARVYGLEAIVDQSEYGVLPDLHRLENILKTEKISTVFLVHHETTTGLLNPVKEVSRMAHANGAQLVLDAMSSYAGMEIDVEAMGIDCLISSSNKCIQGMAGLAFAICRQELLENIKDNRRSYYLDLYAQADYFRRTRQMQFTPPVQVCYSLRTALDEYFTEGSVGRAARYRENWDILYEGLKEIGLRFLLRKEEESGILIAVREPADPAFDFNHLHDYMFERGFTIYPGKGAREATFRLAIIGDLYPADIRAFLAELKAYFEANSIKIS